MPTLPGQINFTSNPYNQNNFYLPGGDRNTYGADIESSFNRQLVDKFWTKGLSMINDSDLDAPGVYTAPQVDTFKLAKYMGLLTDFFAKNNGILSASIDKANSGNIFGNLGSLNPVSQTLEYIDPKNGDQNRWFGTLYNDVENQSAFRFKITQVTIDRYNIDNGTNVTALPSTATRIYLGPDPLNASSNTNYLAPMLSGCYNCRRDSCGKGKRMLYFSKNINTLLDPTSTFPQSALPGNTYDEVVMVDAVEDTSDGGAYFDLTRNANRQTTSGTANTSGLVFRNTAISLRVGDSVYVGTFSPTTECIEAPKECQSYQPKVYKYCSPIREYVDCLGCVNKTMFKTWQFPRDMMSPFERLSYTVIKNYKNYWHRVNNDIMLGTPNYMQGYLLPPANPGIGANTNGEIIPFNVSGILPQFDAFAQKIMVPLTGCDQTAQFYALETIIKAMDKGSYGLESIYRGAGWLMVGDIDFLDRYYANQLTSYIPTTAADRSQQLQRQSLGYSNTPVSLIAKQNTVQDKLSNEFDQQMDKFGITMSSLQLGKYTFKAIHDDGMAAKEPGVVRLMHIPSISFFTDGQDDYMASMFGGKSPFLPASGIQGRLIPSVVSYDMASTYLDSKIEFKANRDCPISFFAYMRAGVRIKSKLFPHMMKIQFTSITTNPSYNPLDPTSSPVIYGDVNNLNCGAMRASRLVELNLDQWQNPTYTNPINI